MSSSALSTPHRRSTTVLLALGLSVATAMALLSIADASSHREAPLIMEDPVADNTDLYAFTSPDRPDTVTLLANFVPFQEPGGGPNYFRFGEDVRYNIHIDNTGDANPDITYEFRFTNAIQNPNEYLYGDPVAALDGRGTLPITNLDDDTYNFRQTMSVFEVRNGRRTALGSNLTLPPEHVGPITTGDDANYNQLAQQAVHDVARGIRVFAGQRDDPFYVDIASIFDIGTLRPFQGAHALTQRPAEEGRDTFAGYNVHTLGLQVPKTLLRGAANDPVIGVYSTAERRKVRVFAQNSSAAPVHRGRWVQVSRLGMPLVNEVVVPLGLKDAFNSIPPSADADVFPQLDAPPLSTEGPIPLVTDPILAAQINAVYGIEVPPAPREDLVAIFLTGIEGVNQSPRLSRPSEMMRLNMDVAPSNADLNANNRLGVLAGENDGFPNGRRPGDDVVDIALRAVAGATPFTPDFNVAPNNELTDGVIRNDKPFLNQFPYLATPHRGFDLTNRDRVPGAQPQTPGS
ncbi:MAG TPA: DUF4331 domain-containing protein [Egibacteraceae bacterium]|jgi:hypothetical protein|nr:DUF4331 domain-containing protein [Egibacteraceae bacterium]